MFISSATIENYRAVQRISVSFQEYNTFIGYNGSGKSSILRAIDWFFTGSPLEEEDYHFSQTEGTRSRHVSVEITFTGLDAIDRRNFGKYARGEEMTLKRTSYASGDAKLFGMTRVHTKLRETLQLGGIAAIRKSIRDILSSEDLPFPEEWETISSKKKLLEFIEEWESDSGNWKHLNDVPEDDASHLKGVAGSSLVQSQTGFIFIPAAPDLSEEFSSEDKQSALSILLGSLMKDSVNTAIEAWKTDNADVLIELDNLLQGSTRNDLEEYSNTVNSYLNSYDPNSTFKIDLSLPDWNPKVQPVAQATLSQDGLAFPVEKMGHGTQRATLLAVLQAVAERRTVTSPDGDTHCPGENLIVVIEEPEVYQHPVQARKLATALRNAAETKSIQVICATHSPYFVSASNLSSTHRVVPSRDGATLKGGSFVGQFEDDARSGKAEKWFRTTIIEGLFSEACLVVEGDTDQFVFENVKIPDSAKGNRHLSLSDHGISVVNAQGGDSLWPIVNLIESFGVPCYVVHDGDSSESRSVSRSNDNKTPEQIQASWKAGVEKFASKARQMNHGQGLEGFEWGDGPAYGESVSILNDDLEAELESWPTFMENLPASAPQDLRKAKHAGVYSRTLQAASLSDCPESIIKIFDSVLKLAKGEQSSS